jgi:hypothetical protein
MPGCRYFAVAGLALLLAVSGVAAEAAEPVAVEVLNASRKTGCAEEDNVYVKLLGAGITGFRLRVQHPPYIGDIADDSTAPDFSRCDMSHDPSFSFAPRDVTLYEDAQYRLLGHTYKTNWRPDIVPFRVAGREERGLHLVQLFKVTDGVPIEIVVLYPADGYWRAKPLPPPNLVESAYGSSFLFGPIDEEGRPLVAISEVTFVPETVTFHLRFARGGTGTLAVREARADGLDLDIGFDASPNGTSPFAALRSMFVTPLQADVSDVSWRPPNGNEAMRPILELDRATAIEARFGRATKSLHNLSAPDLVFGGFRRGASE